MRDQLTALGVSVIQATWNDMGTTVRYTTPTGTHAITFVDQRLEGDALYDALYQHLRGVVL